MKKERLLRIKENSIKGNTPWYVKMSDEEIGSFSVAQLELLCEIAKRSEEFRESCDPFYTLSATEVLQKSSNRIAEFTDVGKINEVSRDNVLSGAAKYVFKNYLDKTGKKPLV